MYDHKLSEWKEKKGGAVVSALGTVLVLELVLAPLARSGGCSTFHIDSRNWQPRQLH